MLKSSFLWRLIILISLLSMSHIGFAKNKKKRTSSQQDNFHVIMSTEFDFGETKITGEAKAPDGFFLQGKQSQSLSQMVRLRSHFREAIRNSRARARSASH